MGLETLVGRAIGMKNSIFGDERAGRLERPKTKYKCIYMRHEIRTEYLSPGKRGFYTWVSPYAYDPWPDTEKSRIIITRRTSPTAETRAKQGGVGAINKV